MSSAGRDESGATLARALFAPRAVALVGASGDASKNTARPQRFLRKHGYSGAIYPVNPSRAEIFGERAYPTLVSIGAPIDHAFIMLPTDRAIDAIRECGAAGVPVATVFADGFAEIGAEGLQRQDELLAAARGAGVRVLGPNCLGLVSAHDRLALTVNATLEVDALRAGGVSVVSQSGSMLGAILSRGLARGFGFAKLVSVGNESDIGVGELIELLADDAHTTTIALFLETLRDADRIGRAARRALTAGKPVVAYKLGRSGVGQALAVSHTGAMAGADDAASAFFRAHGIVRVDQLETLLEIAPLVAGRAPPPAGARRVAVVTTTGGGAASVADRLGTLGLATATPDDALVAALAAEGVAIRKTPILDLTLTATPDVYGRILTALDAWPGCDATLAVVGSSAQFHPQVAVQPIVTTPRGAKPLVAFLAPEARESLAWLAENGVAAFRTPEACADALAAYFAWRAPTPIESRAAPSVTLPAAGGRASEADALAVFAALGVEVAPSALARAPDFTHGLTYPVAVKIASRDIAHKTEAGGVVLDVADAAALRSAAERVVESAAATHPHARVDGVLVQPMQRGVGEAIVGYRHDPLVGPVMLVGVGGTLAELYRDYALALAPVGLERARELIASVRGFAALAGFRGRPRGDLDALAHAVVALSQLARVPGQPVAEAEINPLVVRDRGVVAVDGLLTMRARVP